MAGLPTCLPHLELPVSAAALTTLRQSRGYTDTSGIARNIQHEA